jgi:hypothetical protein
MGGAPARGHSQFSFHDRQKGHSGHSDSYGTMMSMGNGRKEGKKMFKKDVDMGFWHS